MFVFDDVPVPKCLRDTDTQPLLDLTWRWFDLVGDLVGSGVSALAAFEDEASKRRKSKFSLSRSRSASSSTNVRVVKMNSGPADIPLGRGNNAEDGDDSLMAPKIEKLRKTTTPRIREKEIKANDTLTRSPSGTKVSDKRVTKLDFKGESPTEALSEPVTPEISKKDLKVLNENLRKSKVASMMGEQDVLTVTVETQMQQSSKLQALLGEVSYCIKISQT